MAQAGGHNAYMPGYAAKQVTHHEWRNAENSAAYLLSTLTSKAEKDPNLRLLDVGCGSGTITASLAKYMPAGHITATDVSEEILPRAREFAAEAGASNISFQTADVYSLPFEDASFDIVHASMVLTHLDAPVQALKEMLRVTKPGGGVVACRESDLRMWSYYPPLSGMEKTQKLLLATHEASGGSVNGAAPLLAWAMQAGAKRQQVAISFSTWSYSTPSERRIWGGALAERIRSGGMRKKALEMGITTEAELQEMAEAWDEWIEQEDASFGCMHGEILVSK